MTPQWLCSKCGRPVALMDGEPFTWWEPHFKAGEISPAYAICESWPDCATEKPTTDSEVRPTDES